MAPPDGGRKSESVKRRYVDLETRAATMRKEMPGWRHPLTIAGVIATLLIITTFTRTLSKHAYELAGRRDQAAFVAANAATALGMSSPSIHANGNVSSRDSLYYFLHDALGPSGADARARLDVPVWYWRFIATAGSREMNRCRPERQVQRLDRTIQDSATVPSIPVDSARARDSTASSLAGSR